MKRITGFMIFFMAVVLMSGCGATLPELSEEQTDLVTEYAAGLLIKYNALPDNNLLNEAQMEEEEKKEAEEKEKERKKKEAEKAYLESKAAKENENTTQSEGDGDTAAPAKEDPTIEDLASFYELSDFSISYSGYQLCQSYPDEDRDDFFLAMEATEGKKLCILQFNVTNTSGTDSEFDMFAKQGIFYVSIDGQEKIPVQSTLLLDDLATYKGIIASGESVPMILVCEVEETTEQIGGMELTAKYGTQKGTIILQ